VLRWDPTLQADIAEAGLTVAGVEAALWCESVTSFDDAATLLLPRLGLVAQVCWGGPLGGDVAEADVLAAARAQADAWDALGFSAYYRSAGVLG
jgi:hexosaminidase